MAYKLFHPVPNCNTVFHGICFVDGVAEFDPMNSAQIEAFAGKSEEEILAFLTADGVTVEGGASVLEVKDKTPKAKKPSAKKAGSKKKAGADEGEPVANTEDPAEQSGEEEKEEE